MWGNQIGPTCVDIQFACMRDCKLAMKLFVDPCREGTEYVTLSSGSGCQIPDITSTKQCTEIGVVGKREDDRKHVCLEGNIFICVRG